MPVPAIVAGAAVVGGTIAKGISASQAEGEQQRTRQAAMAAAGPSAAELAAIDKQIQVSDRAIARQEALIASIDPALMEAGKQALQLLQGKEAASLDPMRKAQARQTAQMQARLQEQLGGGYATSSAGIEAMARLQEGQIGQQVQAQQQTLGQLLGLSAQVRPNEAQMVAMAGAPIGAYQNIADRQLRAIMGTPTSAGGVAGAIGGGFDKIASVATGMMGVGMGGGGFGGFGGGGGSLPVGGGGAYGLGGAPTPRSVPFGGLGLSS